MGGRGSGERGGPGHAPPPPWPHTHAGSSPEGHAAFDEEHPHVAVADQEQHAAEAQVDEADEDLDRLRGAGGCSAGRRAGPTPPSAGRGGERAERAALPQPAEESPRFRSW